MLHVAHITKLSAWLVSGGIFLSVANAEEEDTGTLQIESVPDELSADIHITKEEGKEPPRSEAEDKKRTNLGIGEFVILSLTGKPSLIGDVEKLEWEVISNMDIVHFIGKRKGAKKVKFQVSPYVKEGGNLTIQVKTSANLKKL